LVALETKRYIIAVLFCLGFMQSWGQFFDRDKWQERRHQLTFGLGASNFLGDLGGKDDIGTNDFQDLELNQTRFAAFVGYKYALYRKLHFRADFTWGQMSGDDKLTQEIFRNNRNLNFRTHIFELSGMLELEVPIRRRKGHIYDIKGVKGWKYKGATMYLFAGIGGFHYNPKTLLDGQWIPLRPLRTEGQGLPGGPDEYGKYSLCIPLGISISKRISHQFSLALEATYRYTFTDYIDDVSTDYYSPDDLQLYLGGAQGDLAAYLSNPAQGVANGGLSGRVTATGQQRGDPEDRDGYMFVWIKGQYLLQDQYGRKGKFNPSKGKYRPVQRRGRAKKITF
jgi:hypothetical protein